MRISLTKFGLPEVFVVPAAIISIMVLAARLITTPPIMVTIQVLLGAAFIWVLAFFRDPERKTPDNKNLLVAPADGKITDIETVENEFLGGTAVKIGIFLSVFNVHINRSPCDCVVENIVYKKGAYKNALNPLSAKVNESNSLYLTSAQLPQQKIIIRQISGAIARRIVCRVKQGQKLTGGQKFGMIKFGSRTELCFPAELNVKVLVEKGDKVKAGVTILAQYC